MSSRRKVAYATSAALREGTPDDWRTRAGLESHGFELVAAVWDDPTVDWASFEAVVIRSTWDYFHRRDAFLAWVDRAAEKTRVWNSPTIVRWNSHKAYLRDLEARGVPIVATEVVARGDRTSVRDAMRRRGWTRAVVKPAVAANAYGLKVVDVDALGAEGSPVAEGNPPDDLLVQPVMELARSLGERSVIVVDGAVSHTVEYPFVLGGAPREGRSFPLDAATRTVALAAVAAAPAPTLYARVDLLPERGGRWVVGELELIEPELFFRVDPGAPAPFVDALVRRLEGPR